MGIRIKSLESGDAAVLQHIAPGVFDDPIIPAAAAEFLADPRHHMVVALDEDAVVGFVSAVHYVHPDKPAPELWVNELGVAPTHRGRGLARELLGALFRVARDLGCSEAWVLADGANRSALSAYTKSGGIRAPRDQVMLTFRLDEARGPHQRGGEG